MYLVDSDVCMELYHTVAPRLRGTLVGTATTALVFLDHFFEYSVTWDLSGTVAFFFREILKTWLGVLLPDYICWIVRSPVPSRSGRCTFMVRPHQVIFLVWSTNNCVFFNLESTETLRSRKSPPTYRQINFREDLYNDTPTHFRR